MFRNLASRAISTLTFLIVGESGVDRSYSKNSPPVDINYTPQHPSSEFFVIIFYNNFFQKFAEIL